MSWLLFTARQPARPRIGWRRSSSAGFSELSNNFRKSGGSVYHLLGRESRNNGSRQRTFLMASDQPPRSVQKRILIVEDNELNMKLLNDVLEAYGYDIIKTASGAAVLELARQHGPDLILIDIQLPDISGLEAVRQLKGDAQTKAIPVIAVTAFAMAGDERRALASGCDGYIAKPIMLREFLVTVENFIGRGPAKD
jgi:two-component system cell cycle response regulator DivK